MTFEPYPFWLKNPRKGRIPDRLKAQQFFKWLAAEDDLPDPMERLRGPKVAEKMVPVFTSIELSQLAKACRGNTFADRRDAAIIAVFRATGIRLFELAGICYVPDDHSRTDLDLEGRQIRICGKGGKGRIVKIGHEAARALDRYLRVRGRHAEAYRPQLWLGVNNRGPVTRAGIYQIVARRGQQCGVAVYPHRFRHHFSHTWRPRRRPDGTVRLDLTADASPLRRQRPRRPRPPHLRPHHGRPAMTRRRRIRAAASACSAVSTGQAGLRSQDRALIAGRGNADSRRSRMGQGKLVRDKIPQIIRGKGLEPVTYVASAQEYATRLRDKLTEEVAEFLDSDSDPEELADVLEVVYALAGLAGTDPQQLEKLRAAKADERGGFADRIIWTGNQPTVAAGS